MDQLKKRFRLMDDEEVNVTDLKFNKNRLSKRENKQLFKFSPIIYSLVILLVCCIVSVSFVNRKDEEDNVPPTPNIEDNTTKLTTRKSLNYGIYYGSKKMLDKDEELDYLNVVGTDNVTVENENDGIVSEVKYNYEFDFIEVFEVYSFNITCEDSFLFPQFNERDYEVIISKLNIGNWVDEYIIIIKGENCIVSYLTNGLEQSSNEIKFNFSSHKYLAGNSIEKNISEDFYIRFYVTINLSSKYVTEMYSTISNGGEDGQYHKTDDYITNDKAVDYKKCDVSHIFQFEELTDYLMVNLEVSYVSFDIDKLLVSDNSSLGITEVCISPDTPIYLYDKVSNTITPIDKESLAVELSQLYINSNIQLRFMYTNAIDNEVTKVEQIILNYNVE